MPGPRRRLRCPEWLRDGLVATVGDRILTRYNDRRLRTSDGYVRNGAMWRLVAVHRDGSVTARPLDAAGGRPDDAGRRGSDPGHRLADDADRRRDDGAVRLPAPYVAEHLELGYAVTTARSQGLTVDATHTIAAPGMAREDLYVAMTRGRESNHVYVATDLFDDQCPSPAGRPRTTQTGRDVLERVLTTSHVELSATETWARFQPGRPVPMPSADQLRARDARPAEPSRHRSPVYSPPPPARVIGRSL